MMKRTSLALLSLLAIAAPAQALKLIVWDPDFKNKVAYGETSGGRLNVKFDKDYSGPVVALFSQSDEEKNKGTYAGLRSSYVGVLRGGQILLEPADNTPSSPANANAAQRGNGVGNGLGNNGVAGNAAKNASTISLPKLLQPYKLNVNVQPTSQLLPLSNSLLVRTFQADAAQTLG